MNSDPLCVAALGPVSPPASRRWAYLSGTLLALWILFLLVMALRG